MPQVSLRKHLGRIAFTVLRANNITGTHGAIRWMLTEGSTLLHVWRTQPLKQGRDAQRKALRGEMSPFPCISLISYSWVTVPTGINTKHQNHNRGNRLFPTFISSSISESFRSRARFSCLQGFITETVRGVYKKNKACSLLKKSKLQQSCISMGAITKKHLRALHSQEQSRRTWQQAVCWGPFCPYT